MVPTGTGDWLTLMVTSNDCVAERPPGSVAVTVIAALPSATPVTVTVGPETLTVAKLGSDDLAV